MKCFELIEENINQYNYYKSKTLYTMIDNTEHYYHIRELSNKEIKEDCLLLVFKFQNVLEAIEQNLFKENINDLKEIYKEIEKLLV